MGFAETDTGLPITRSTNVGRLLSLSELSIFISKTGILRTYLGGKTKGEHDRKYYAQFLAPTKGTVVDQSLSRVRLFATRYRSATRYDYH